MIPVLVTIEVDPQRICDLIISAIDGACDYWTREGIGLFEPIDNPDGGKEVTCSRITGDLTNVIFFGNSVLCFIEDGDDVMGVAHKIELMGTCPKQVVKGLKVMAEKQPEHFANILMDNPDDETADIFIQCCTFGKVVYG